MAYRTRMEMAKKAVVLGLAGIALLGAAGCRSVNLPFVGRNAEDTRVSNDEGVTIGVNAYLWRAALDTLAFMPLANADPYGGVIVYDWYSEPGRPNERYKATVYILDTRLRADGLNVSINRQLKNGADWVEAPTAADTEDLIENSILTRARQIRVTGR